MKSPTVDYRHLARLVEEFNQLWTRLQGFYLDAAAGFGYVRTAVIDEQASARNAVRGSELDSEGFQDTRMFSYDGIFPKPFCTSGIHSVTQGEVKRRNEASGENFTTLGQLCIVSFYDFWSDYMRQEYVIAKGNLRRDEKDRSVKLKSLRAHSSFDLWGDLYYFRTSIVHNKGIATSDVAKCKVFRWFEPGDVIAITPEYMWEIFMELLEFRNQIFREQFPPCTIAVTF